MAIDAETGVSAMLVKAACVTVMLADDAVIPFKDADMLVVPTATPSTTPVFAPTVAVAGAPELQFTCVVRLAVVLSE